MLSRDAISMQLVAPSHDIEYLSDKCIHAFSSNCFLEPPTIFIPVATFKMLDLVQCHYFVFLQSWSISGHMWCSAGLLLHICIHTFASTLPRRLYLTALIHQFDSNRLQSLLHTHTQKGFPSISALHMGMTRYHHHIRSHSSHWSAADRVVAAECVMKRLDHHIISAQIPLHQAHLLSAIASLLFH